MSSLCSVPEIINVIIMSNTIIKVLYRVSTTISCNRLLTVNFNTFGLTDIIQPLIRCYKENEESLKNVPLKVSVTLFLSGTETIKFLTDVLYQLMNFK